MELKIIRGTNNIGKQLLQISSEQSKIAISFGEDKSTSEIPEKINPMIEGLTCGNASYDGIFILRNPENCNLIDFSLEDVPIYLEKKINLGYEICSDFMRFKKRTNIKEILNTCQFKIKDMSITYFLIDGSNHNTSMLLVESNGKKVLISGDFRSFDLRYGKKNLKETIDMIGKIDYWFIDGKYFGKNGVENSSDLEFFNKLKNIMKFYKQVFIIQSETDLITAKRIYEVSIKTRKNFIEDTFLANLTTTCTGSAPSPVINKKVYTYNPLFLDDKEFEFKKKYVTHFYIHNANNKMQKENYVMNINTRMLQDIQVFYKEELAYDACIILAINKQNVKRNKELEEFINLLKDLDMDYYELYSVGNINYELINDMIIEIKPKNIIPLEFNPIENVRLYNLRNLRENELIEI